MLIILQKLCKKLVCVIGIALLFGCSAPLKKSSAEDSSLQNSSSLESASHSISPKNRKNHYPTTYKVRGKKYHVVKNAKDFHQRGYASWYGKKFENKRTSSGERFHRMALTAAHKTLPIDSYVKVKNLKNGKEVIVKINDRGPFVGERVIDLSYLAAKKLGIVGEGSGYVEIATVEFKNLANAAETVAKTQEALMETSSNPSQNIAETSEKTDVTIKKTKFLEVGSFQSKKLAQSYLKNVQRMTQAPVDIQPLKRSSKKPSHYLLKIGPIDSDQLSELREQLHQKLKISETAMQEHT